MLRLELGRAAQVRSVAGTLGAARQASEALVRPRTGLGSPLEGVIASAVSGPRIERIEDSVELRFQLGGRPQQHSLQWRDFPLVTVVCPGLHDPTVRPVIRHPLDAEARIELRPETGREEPIAEQASGRVEIEDLKLRLRDRKSVGTRRLR